MVYLVEGSLWDSQEEHKMGYIQMAQHMEYLFDMKRLLISKKYI